MERRRGAGEIPKDVLVEILKRLPVKSICRFKSVSTSWLSVISDPCFIRSHYAHSETSSKLLVMGSRKGELCEWLIYDQDYSTLVAAPPKLPIPDSTTAPLPSRSAHGMICLDLGGGDIRVVNPSTGEYISIPPPRVTGITGSPTNHYHISFGFDPVADKHKVLFSYEAFDSQCQNKKVMEHWVLTLGSVEMWRRTGVHNIYQVMADCGEVCINGVIYFLAFYSESGKEDDSFYYFAAFDLKSESFQIVKFPGPTLLSMLVEFNGSVALVDNFAPGRIFSVWLLEEFHEQFWSLKRSILASDSMWEIIEGRYLRLACALRGGKLLVFMPCNQEAGPFLDFFFYNFDSNDLWTRRIDVQEGDLFVQSSKLICSDHVESLLPLR